MQNVRYLRVRKVKIKKHYKQLRPSKKNIFFLHCWISCFFPFFKTHVNPSGPWPPPYRLFRVICDICAKFHHIYIYIYIGYIFCFSLKWNRTQYSTWRENEIKKKIETLKIVLLNCVQKVKILPFLKIIKDKMIAISFFVVYFLIILSWNWIT